MLPLVHKISALVQSPSLIGVGTPLILKNLRFGTKKVRMSASKDTSPIKNTR